MHIPNAIMIPIVGEARPVWIFAYGEAVGYEEGVVQRRVEHFSSLGTAAPHHYFAKIRIPLGGRLRPNGIERPCAGLEAGFCLGQGSKRNGDFDLELSKVFETGASPKAEG